MRICVKSRPCAQYILERIYCYDLAQHAVPVLAPSFSSGDASTLLTASCRPSPGSPELHPQATIMAVLTGLLAMLTLRAAP